MQTIGAGMGSLTIAIGAAWTSNDFVALFTALAEINALVESIHDPALLISRDDQGQLRFRRRPIPQPRQVWVRSIDFHSPGDIRIDVGLAETARTIREWAKDASWREDFERRIAAEELKRSEMNSAAQRLGLAFSIISAADELGVRPEDLADYVIPKMVKAVRVLDRLRAEERVRSIEDVSGDASTHENQDEDQVGGSIGDEETER